MHTHEFNNKTFLVTGATSGIGKATALEAIHRGANVSIAARREKELNEIFSSFPSVEIIPSDVTNENDRKRIVEKTLQRFSGIDVLVNAAGII